MAGGSWGEPRQVLIVRTGQLVVGVVVQRAIDVVDEPLELQPASRPGVRGTMVVDGKAIEVLDLPALLAMHGPDLPLAGGGRVMRQLATFSVQGRTLGVDVARVREVTRARELTPVPLAGPAIAGLMNLRGEIVTAIDLRVRLGLPPVDADEVPGMHVVLSGAEPVSLLVDEVGDVVEVDEDAFEPPPIAVGGPAGELILGAHPREDVLLLELDLDRALDARTEGTR